jgi:NAD(P)-dependent dehydrogenase (short-subunit alcohol dehydrogenase family)
MSHFLWRRGEDKATRYNGVKRLGIPDDIAKVVHFLLSEEAGYMTGESVVVAGRPGARL